ncbi:MAG TPA: xanthine dehydrogenase family protein subunit M [Bryobacteraceae bacterium]|nr:xanthine dehydrogenase family protein subunit M [Bryobacteraceae bacterium]
MIPQTFEYTAPATLDAALEALGSGERKLLAGGQSLIPLMKLRLAAPDELIDLGRIPGLDAITESSGRLHVGAMATHHAIETSPMIRGFCPLLAETAGRIGDVQVRNMGTIGGSVVHADPASDYPAALLALEARVHLISKRGERAVDYADFLLDAFTTALEPDEMVHEIEVPAEGSHEGYRYEKAPHPASGFAVVGVAVRIEARAGRITLARVAVTGMGPHAFRDRAVEKLLEDGTPIPQAVAPLGDGQDANSDAYASGDYRRHLARVYAARALTTALSRAV